jgi:hypothetical protein
MAFDLSVAERENALRDVIRRCRSSKMGSAEPISLPPEDLRYLRNYAVDDSPRVRATAIRFLADNGPIVWQDFDAWVLDPCEYVGAAVMCRIKRRSTAVGRLCAEDKARCVATLAAAVEFREYETVGFVWNSLAKNDDVWLEAIWPHAGRLVDLDCEGIDRQIVFGFLVNIVIDRSWGPMDTHLNTWIIGKSVARKNALLSVAACHRLSAPELLAIVNVLALDADEKIRARANRLLARHAEHQKKRERTEGLLMRKQQSVSKRWLELIPSELSDTERAEELEVAIQQAVKDGVSIGDRQVCLAAEDIGLLRHYARDPSPQVRAVAIDYMTEYGPCSWEDLEQWSQDSDALVRQNVLSSMYSDLWSAGKLCTTNKQRCIDILSATIENYVDSAAGNLMDNLRQIDDEWLELTWSTAESLLDLKKPDIALMLTCCYFEHVIPESGWGSDHLNLRHWVEGDDSERKMILLKIANYMGLEEGRMRDLAEVLQSDPDPRIASIADGILNGCIETGELWQDADADSAEEDDEDDEDIEE